MSRDHRKLDAFNLADEFLLMTYRATREFPKEAMFCLTAQLRRAALSVPSNIVEGCACHHESQYIEHLNRAFGSLREAGYQMTVGERLGYMKPDLSAPRAERFDRTARCRAALIRSLRTDEYSLPSPLLPQAPTTPSP
jgi:four helix bundle protein